MMRTVRLLAGLALACLAGLAPADGLAQTRAAFGNVAVACDEDLACVAAVPARAADGTVVSVLQVGRTPATRSRWTIAVSTLVDLADRNRPVSFNVDGGVGITLRPGADYAPFVQAGTFYVLSQYALDRLMVDMQVGYQARFSYIDIAGAPHTDRYDLDGLTAALSEIDRIQRRIVGDRRAGPPDDLPPAPDVDREAMIAVAGVPDRLVDLHIASSACEAPDGPALSGIEPVIAALSETAMLYALPCFARADGPSYRLYVIESGEIGGMHTLYFAVWSPTFAWTGVDTLEAIAYDGETNRLTGLHRGLGGCAAFGVWAFEQLAFRLVEMRAPATCGPDAGDPAGWPVVFPK